VWSGDRPPRVIIRSGRSGGRGVDGDEQVVPGGLPGPVLGQVEVDGAGTAGQPGGDVDGLGADGRGTGGRPDPDGKSTPRPRRFGVCFGSAGQPATSACRRPGRNLSWCQRRAGEPMDSSPEGDGSNREAGSSARRPSAAVARRRPPVGCPLLAQGPNHRMVIDGNVGARPTSPRVGLPGLGLSSALLKPTIGPATAPWICRMVTCLIQRFRRTFSTSQPMREAASRRRA